MNEDDLRKDPKMKAWFDEIDAVAAGIQRWLESYPEIHQMLETMGRTAIVMQQQYGNLDRCVEIISNCEELLWVLMDAQNWLGINYKYGEIWQCAYHQAMGKIES